MTRNDEEGVDSVGLLMTGKMEDIKRKKSILLWSIKSHCLLLTLVELRRVYSRLSFMRLEFFADSCWCYGNKWVHHVNKWVLKIRQEKDLEWGTQEYYTKDEVTKEIPFPLHHFFQLHWITAAFGQLLIESFSIRWSSIIKPGNLYYSALLSHVRLQKN